MFNGLQNNFNRVKDQWSSRGTTVQLIIVSCVLVVFALLFLWIINKIFIYVVARSYIDNIADVFNLDANLAKAIALVTFLVSAYFISKTFSFSSSNRRIGYLGIVFLLIANSIVLWMGTRSHYFDETKAIKCYVLSRSVGVKFRELGREIDPETGLPCRTYTPVIFERLKKYQQGFRPRPFETGQEFFDTTTGEPVVWYWKSKTGEIKLFDLMGFSPEDGEELKYVTPEIVDAFKEQEINRQKELDRLNKPPRPVDPNTYPPFDAATGKPQVWYWRDPNGNYEFFDNQGFHPTTGDELKIVNKGVINAWKQFLIDKKQAEEESKARRERQLQLQREQEIKHQQDLEQRRRDEQEATERRAQSGVMCDQAAANPNDRQKSSSVPGVTYDAINLSEALNICRIAVYAFPDEPRFKYQYARSLESSDPNAAIKIYGQLTRQRYAASFDNLGSLLLKRRDISGAIAAFKNGSQRRPRLNGQFSWLNSAWTI
jgi:hypothetical protein